MAQSLAGSILSWLNINLAQSQAISISTTIWTIQKLGLWLNFNGSILMAQFYWLNFVGSISIAQLHKNWDNCEIGIYLEQWGSIYLTQFL